MGTIYEINAFLKELLDPFEMADVALNGIQVENEGIISKIAFAVDASFDAIERARAENCNLLIVHHGFFWGKVIPITGNFRKRIRTMLTHNIGLIAYHLPLDAHPQYGNNSQLLRTITNQPLVPFGKSKTTTIGFMTTLAEPLKLDTIISRINAGNPTWPQVILPFGTTHVRTIAAVSGSGANTIDEAIEKNIDLLITGEAPHHLYHTAKEAGINVLSAGHYFTETFGVKALMEPIKKQFNVETLFFDIPTGL
ncbi:MAG: Nif3-like dinuclear metal center hexameric protein [Spirochaetes bacterium]|nr:Nif3-like dinuclear metal center hexameric protein [Spirochaetota bacterium]